MSDETIIMYSTTWCGDCRRAKRVLDERGVSYRSIDIEKEPGTLETMMELNGGTQSVPTILFPDGSVLVEPSNRELAAHLDRLAA
jgi:mycoredoxin